MLGFFTSLICNFLFISDPNVSLVQIPDTSNLKHLLGYSSFFSSKKGCFAASIISISLLRSLLPKLSIFGAFSNEYTAINTVLPIPRPKPRSIRKIKILTCNNRQILIDKFIDRIATSIFFPPSFTNHLSQNAIECFQSHITKVATDVKNIYLSYGLFNF